MPLSQVFNSKTLLQQFRIASSPDQWRIDSISHRICKLFCFVLVRTTSCGFEWYIHQRCFTGTAADTHQWQWSSTEEIGKINGTQKLQNTTKSKQVLILWDIVTTWLTFLTHIFVSVLSTHYYNQIAMTIWSTSIRHRSDTFASDRCLIDIDPMVFATWVVAPTSWIK